MMSVITSLTNAIHLIPLDAYSKYSKPTTTTLIEPIKSSIPGLALVNQETILTHQTVHMNTAITALYYKIST
jgi:hypothetical protein